MKSLKFISFLVVIILCLTNTTCNDDDVSSVLYEVVNNEIIKIEDQVNSLSLGESITIETAVNMIQNTTNNVELNLLDFVDNEEVYNNLVLYRLNNNSIERVPFEDLNISPLEGNVVVQANNSDNIFPSFNVTSTLIGNLFKNKFAITPTEPGTYFLGPNDSVSDNETVTFFFNENANNESLLINTVIEGSNAEGLYEFVVN